MRDNRSGGSRGGNDRNDGGFRGGSRGGNGGYRGGNGGGNFRSSGPREMHKATCADCNQETEVPFKPTEGRPVYCRECFQNHRPPKRY
ncbi:CxxC-x17-CxxC domain-containing protein [Methanolobus mangrovi]|uniref:CxxC-x17-CxxC domain-containing protein n=1 Tax=Methanolobus mangrovi TaxID=3072977 RepID=A0AA51YJ77_9EURY|nr:CxxC-x17-CxxC domain-containing protein [Methanolobus mangrovi]WMW22308.1 CxxC-x17-CxxC domain-containing protein [Methanolobus mangrovi]